MLRLRVEVGSVEVGVLERGGWRIDGEGLCAVAASPVAAQSLYLTLRAGLSLRAGIGTQS
jgi:hypothetical protein